MSKSYSSTGTNYVFNKHEDLDQYGPYAIPSEKMTCYSYPASLMNSFDWVIMLKAHVALIMSLTSVKIWINMAHMQYSYPASLMNPFDWVIMLKAHVTLIMSLTSVKIWINMAHMQYRPRKWHVTATLQVLWIYLTSWLSYHVNVLICH